MVAPMQPFIAEALRVITQELCVPAAGDPAGALTRNAHPQILDIDMAETVAAGSLVFPSEVAAAEPDWCVLALYAIEGATRTQHFRFRGRLRANLPAADFVEQSYELILTRKVDEVGRMTYASLLEQRKLTKRDVLKILAGCTEAQALDETFVIIPEPSSWLSKLGVTPGLDSSFPPVSVLMTR
jgi:Domain of unknown function (DUF4214)